MLFFFLQVAIVASNFVEFINSNELWLGVQLSFYPSVGVRDQLVDARAPIEFHISANFTLDEIVNLCLDVHPKIVAHLRTTNHICGSTMRLLR